MLIVPVRDLLGAFAAGTLSASMILVSVIKIFLSLTVGGFLWCVGYVGYNYFRGTEDPDWEEINRRIAENQELSGEEKKS